MNNRGMTPIQHHAMCLAAAGHWQLADALELQLLNSEDNTVQAAFHPISGPLQIGRGDKAEAFECEECEGTGEQECNMGHYHDCPECEGTGLQPQVRTEPLVWATLDGDEPTVDATKHPQRITTVADALTLIRDYTRLIERLQGNEQVPA